MFAPSISRKPLKARSCLHSLIIDQMPAADFSGFCRSYHARLS